MLSGLFPDLRRDVAFPLAGAVILFASSSAVACCTRRWRSGCGRAARDHHADRRHHGARHPDLRRQHRASCRSATSASGPSPATPSPCFAIAPLEKASVYPRRPLRAGRCRRCRRWRRWWWRSVVTLVVAVVVGLGLARSGAQSGAVSATVITLALLFVTHEVARNWPELTGGDRAGLFFSIGGTLKTPGCRSMPPCWPPSSRPACTPRAAAVGWPSPPARTTWRPGPWASTRWCSRWSRCCSRWRWSRVAPVAAGVRGRLDPAARQLLLRLHAR